MIKNDIHADFTQQITQVTGRLRQYALRITKDSEDANDLVQDTLLKAYRHWHTFKPGTSLKAWLFTIMRNTFMTQCGRVKRERRVLVQKPFHELADLTGGALLNGAISQAVLDDIRTATNRLMIEYREPFQLLMDGFKYYEIARQLSIPLGTVKNRIFIARQELKRQLRPRT
jgi:RNA polymerase sigma-70 factor (ECF subfamily)